MAGLLASLTVCNNILQPVCRETWVTGLRDRRFSQGRCALWTKISTPGTIGTETQRVSLGGYFSCSRGNLGSELSSLAELSNFYVKVTSERGPGFSEKDC